MKWIILFTLCLSLNAVAEVSQAEVSKMLQQMVKDNIISAAEAEKARIRMMSMSQKQWSGINQVAHKQAARYPASASDDKSADVDNLNLDGEQFKQIQTDLRMIVPQYKD